MAGRGAAIFTSACRGRSARTLTHPVMIGHRAGHLPPRVRNEMIGPVAGHDDSSGKSHPFRRLALILRVVLTTIATAPPREGSIPHEFLSGDCNSNEGRQVYAVWASPEQAIGDRYPRLQASAYPARPRHGRSARHRERAWDDRR